MPTARFLYQCESAAQQVGVLFRALGEHGLLNFTPERALLEQTVRRCDNCRHGHAAKFCTGWVTEIAPNTATFAPVEIDGRLIRLEVFARLDYRRLASGEAHVWEESPIAACALALQILDIDGRLLERHHLDLANPQQAGPVWHLQYGGNPVGHEKSLTHWLDTPRWAIPPADLALLLEAIAFNFYRDRWDALSNDGAWLRTVTAAEDLTLTAYSKRFQQHLQTKAGNRTQTWLASQDNLVWNPRPSTPEPH